MLTVAALTPSLDLTYLLDEVTPGRIQRTSALVRIAGGKALNMARAATAMGADCHAVVLLGGTTGRALEALLAEEGLSTTVLPAGTETRICVALASAASGELTEAYEEAPPVLEAEISRFCAAADVLARRRPGWLSVSGRAPVGWQGVIGTLVRLGHDAGLRVAVDTHGEALAHAVAERPDLVKVNRSEAAELLAAPTGIDVADLAGGLWRRTGGVTVVTDGVHGAAAVDGRQLLRVGGPPQHGAFPVGSGDSYLGGLVSGLDAGAGLAEAIALATGCATANAMVPGQGRFEPGQARRFTRQTTVLSEAWSSP